MSPSSPPDLMTPLPGYDKGASPGSPSSTRSSIPSHCPPSPSRPSLQAPPRSHPNPAFPAYPPLRNTPFTSLLRATVGDDWATLLQDLHWEPWLSYCQSATLWILPVLLPFFAKPPTVLQLVLIIPMTWALASFCMSVCLHRYFSHKAFRTSRIFQFVLGAMSCLAYQKGPLWWASKHGRHHKYCDTPMDPHSLVQRGFWYSWVGWTCSATEYHLDLDFIAPSFAKCPELQLLDNFWWAPVLAANLSVWKLTGSFEAMVYCLLIPMMGCRLLTLLFNVGFHWDYHSHSLAKCKAMDIGMGLVGSIIGTLGEAHHKHHHDHPSAAHRPGADLAWHLSVRWWSALGLVWDCK